MNQETSTGKFAGGADRRRIARYSCRGLAQIKCLPLDGATLTGRLRDVGLGGCCIENVETTSGFELGTRTEIVIEVDSWIFRAMALVRALRDRSGISLEFVRMSHGGFSRLAEFIADLERPRLAQYARRPLQPTVWNLPTAGLERTNLAQSPRRYRSFAQGRRNGRNGYASTTDRRRCGRHPPTLASAFASGNNVCGHLHLVGHKATAAYLRRSRSPQLPHSIGASEPTLR